MVDKKEMEESCIICEQEKKSGYYLYQSFICIDCENEIVHTETSHPLYKYYVKQLRKVKTSKVIL